MYYLKEAVDCIKNKFELIYDIYEVKDPYKILNYFNGLSSNSSNDEKSKIVLSYLKGDSSKKDLKTTINEKNINKDIASDAMITFLVLNTSGVTIIPMTVIALRIGFSSINPTSVIIPSIIATMISTIGGLTMDYFIRRKNAK